MSGVRRNLIRPLRLDKLNQRLGLPLGLPGELSRRQRPGRFNPHPYRTPLNPLPRRCDPTRVQRRLRHRRQSYPSSRSLLSRSRQKRRAARTGATEAGTTPLRGASSMRITRAGAATATNDQVRAGDQSSRTSGDVRLDSAKWAEADVGSTTRPLQYCTLSSSYPEVT